MTTFATKLGLLAALLATGFAEFAVGQHESNLIPGFVDSLQKISDSEGGFLPPLTDGDFFGQSAAGIGDLDGDGVEDIVVGAAGDDDGGAARGAVYVLFLNEDGTVNAHQKISDVFGGFTGALDDDDSFGNSVESIGDLDGDSVEDVVVGAHQDDDGGGGRGAVWILFLNANGTVKGHQKVSDTEGGFTGTLDDFDQFGSSVAGIGDLDGDGVEDIVVGAFRDDDGGSARGAVWVLFLNANGTVKGHQKVSDTEGGLTGTLDDGDSFGISAAGIGDLDGDNVQDIVVGAAGDGDGGDARGAIWILFLNPNGTAKGYQKISNLEGGFTGTLDDGDFFGRSVAVVGDLDGDNVQDLVVGATGDDDGGDSRGAAWVLFLDSDGTVLFHQKISSLAGGLDPNLLDDFDQLGTSVAAAGDLDNDGVGEFVVGAFQDGDVGAARGAVYLLFVDGTAVLPVELVSFEAASDGSQVVLTWQTASEENNAGFEVQHAEAAGLKRVSDTRMTDSRIAWEPVAFVDGHGTTNDPQSYSYTIVDLSPGSHRFRLKQIDFDGTFEYSDVIEVVTEVPGGFSLSPAYPNPFNPDKVGATIQFVVGTESPVTLDLFDAAGRSIGRLYEDVAPAHAVQTVTLDATGLPGGLYFYRLQTPAGSKSRSVMLLK